ncbi:MAG TPA: p-hydroxycinnamoyl CoA hydratase/lyase [Chloroflexota bacterium]|nr:p-hydroxycinnamoyl CoA hydratase/lyase [Chloroflexota bacterium]
MDLPAYETILLERNVAPGVTLLTFNRPEKRNAMSPRVHEDMTDALERLRGDDDTKVLVITGSGPAFCAGMDLKQFFIELRDQPYEYDRITRLAVEWRGRTLRTYPKPTIAMINGFTFGGAFSIAEGCDLAFAAEDAVFGLSEINFGMFPGGAVSKSLARIMRPRDALFYAMTGKTFTGQQAAEIGFINAALPAGQLRDYTLEIAGLLATKDPHALRAAKEAYKHSEVMDWDAAMSYSGALERMVTLAQQDAWRNQGIGDFLEHKYRPGLEGRQG